MDCGDGISHTVPIYEGYAIPHAVQQIQIAGRHLNTRLLNLLNQKGFSFSSSQNKNNSEVKKIKESLCFVAQDYDAEMKAAQDMSNINQTYKIADQTITISTE